jgi:hypothetical protein
MNQHPQSDSLGDRGEFDQDFSGKGKLYVGRWDNKIHLYGAEWGAWMVDYERKYWGSSPATGDSSPQIAERTQEVVHYKDTNNNGFIDQIGYDYDGDRVIDVQISLLDYADSNNPEPDSSTLYDTANEKWSGLHELYQKIADNSWDQALFLYRALWKKGLTTPELDDLAISSSTAQKHDNGYWLKEKIFRLLDKRLATDKQKQHQLRMFYFTGNFKAISDMIANIKIEANIK